MAVETLTYAALARAPDDFGGGRPFACHAASVAALGVG